MRYQARCNKRICQARRTLAKHPSEYRTWPTCHRPGCTGKMYVDQYRVQRGLRDHPPLCTQDCYHYPHSAASPNCRQRMDIVLAASLARSKHNPNQKIESTAEAPF